MALRAGLLAACLAAALEPSQCGVLGSAWSALCGSLCRDPPEGNTSERLEDVRHTAVDRPRERLEEAKQAVVESRTAEQAAAALEATKQKVGSWQAQAANATGLRREGEGEAADKERAEPAEGAHRGSWWPRMPWQAARGNASEMAQRTQEAAQGNASRAREALGEAWHRGQERFSDVGQALPQAPRSVPWGLLRVAGVSLLALAAAGAIVAVRRHQHSRATALLVPEEEGECARIAGAE